MNLNNILNEIDLYKILHVKPNDNFNIIKKKYYKLCLKYHPDKTNNKDNIKKFNIINMAYNVLSDNEKRDIYNKKYHSKLDYKEIKKDYNISKNNLNIPKKKNLNFSQEDKTKRELKEFIKENKNIDNYLDEIPNLFQNGIFEINTFNGLFEEIKEKYYKNEDSSNVIVKLNENSGAIYSYIDNNNNTDHNYENEKVIDQKKILSNIDIKNYKNKAPKKKEFNMSKSYKNYLNDRNNQEIKPSREYDSLETYDNLLNLYNFNS